MRIRACGGLPRQQGAPCHPEVRERKQRRQVRPVLRQAPVSRLHVAELLLDDPERMLDLRADRGLGPFRHRLGRPWRQQPTLPRWHSHHPLHARGVAPAGDAPVSRVPVDDRLVPVQQRTCHGEVMRVRWGPHHRVHQPRRHVRPDVRLHQGEPLVPLPRLVHLRIPRPRPVLRRAGSTGNGGIDRRPPAQQEALRLQDGIDRGEEPGGQAMRLQQVTEPEHRGRVWDARRTQVDPGECPVDLDVMQRVLDRLVGQREPLLQEVDPQQHQDRVRGMAGEPGRCVRRDQGIPRHHRQHLLQKHLLDRPLGPALESRHQAQLVHAFMIPHHTHPPLPYADNPYDKRQNLR